MKDYYQILGVSKTASTEDIKKAYRKLAHKFHPDRPGGNEAKFKEINEAYQVLGNGEKRAQYDRYGRVFDTGAAGDAPFGGWRPEDIFAGSDFSDIFSDFFEMFGDSRRTARPQDERVRRGKDISLELELPLEAVAYGDEVPVTLRRFVACPACKGFGGEAGSKEVTCSRCSGRGFVERRRPVVFGFFEERHTCPDCRGTGRQPEKACPECRGEGRIETQETIKIAVPSGIPENGVIKLIGKGEAGRKGGVAGDLYVRVHLRPDSRFVREGANLKASFKLPFSTMMLGGKVELETLSGKGTLTIPARTLPGTVLRIKGKGLPRFQQSGFGDLLVEVNFDMSRPLSRRAKDILEELKQEGL